MSEDYIEQDRKAAEKAGLEWFWPEEDEDNNDSYEMEYPDWSERREEGRGAFGNIEDPNGGGDGKVIVCLDFFMVFVTS